MSGNVHAGKASNGRGIARGILNGASEWATAFVLLVVVSVVLVGVAHRRRGSPGGVEALPHHPHGVHVESGGRRSSSDGSVHRRHLCLGWDLSRGRWATGGGACVRGGANVVAGCDEKRMPSAVDVRSWAFAGDVRSRCGLRRVDRAALATRELLRGKHVAVVGDSVTRHVYAAVLRAAADEPGGWSMATAEKHRDWEHRLVGGGRATFTWAPYAWNISGVLRAWASDLSEGVEVGEAEETTAAPARGRRTRHRLPNVLVLGASLWHMLHVGSVEEYERALEGLARELDSPPWSRALGIDRDEEDRGGTAPASAVAFWTTTGALRPEKYTSEHKSRMMTPSMAERFNLAARRSGLLPPVKTARRSKRSSAAARTGFEPPTSAKSPRRPPPCVPLDMEPLTRGCGPACTEDGIHYDNTTYDAAAQIVFNGVRLAWRHRGRRR